MARAAAMASHRPPSGVPDSERGVTPKLSRTVTTAANNCPVFEHPGQSCARAGAPRFTADRAPPAAFRGSRAFIFTFVAGLARSSRWNPCSMRRRYGTQLRPKQDAGKSIGGGIGVNAVVIAYGSNRHVSWETDARRSRASPTLRPTAGRMLGTRSFAQSGGRAPTRSCTSPATFGGLGYVLAASRATIAARAFGDGGDCAVPAAGNALDRHSAAPP